MSIGPSSFSVTDDCGFYFLSRCNIGSQRHGFAASSFDCVDHLLRFRSVGACQYRDLCTLLSE